MAAVARASGPMLLADRVSVSLQQNELHCFGPGWISADWKLSDKGKRAKYYRLTRSGRKQLVAE